MKPTRSRSARFSDAIYGRDNSYGWQMEYATLDNITRDDVVNFYRRYYFPANIMLAVQGDFSAPEMKAKLEKLFGGWSVSQPPVPPFPKVNSHAAPGIRGGCAERPMSPRPPSLWSQLGGVLNDKDYPALEVMSDILGGGFDSRLFLTVRTKLGYAYDISSTWGAGYDHAAIFDISGSTKSASTADTLRAVFAEIRLIQTKEVTEQELKTAKDTVANGFVFSFDTRRRRL